VINDPSRATCTRFAQAGELNATETPTLKTNFFQIPQTAMIEKLF
jgi:hypothetical protein